jgi:hypothetical protein
MGFQWEVFEESTVPDLAPFPEHWYRKYELEEKIIRKFREKLRIKRDEMNRKKVKPTIDGCPLPTLEAILVINTS